MAKGVIITLVIGFIAFELIEHIVFPLFWSVKNRKKRPVSGIPGMLGKVAKVKQWNQTEGQVFINGELWRAVSDVHLSPGDRAVIQQVAGLTLKVKPLND
jgi:membrane-bound serine protease (ClpP class)